ncbi:MAG: shikimate dehydrogenase [Alicyclobacillus sp.]|nr:shikimate dehydrogenase [Alicyclobacillus sp.]
MTTRLFGLLGYPVAHSVSPQMMNRAFAAVGLDAVYLPFAVDARDLRRALDGLAAIGVSGMNVTIPHKTAVFDWVADVTPEAKRAGAVNTLVPDGTGGYIGHNTDVDGWWQSVRPCLATRHLQRVLVFGAGGAARGVLVGLSLHCANVAVAVTARRADVAQALAAAFADVLSVEVVPWDARHQAAAEADWLIQTTSVGMWPAGDASVLEDDSCLSPRQLVQDVVYRPLRTRLLAAAERCGATVVDGLGMLVGQGARAFELWTGVPAPVAAMREAALQALGSHAAPA